MTISTTKTQTTRQSNIIIVSIIFLLVYIRVFGSEDPVSGSLLRSCRSVVTRYNKNGCERKSPNSGERQHPTQQKIQQYQISQNNRWHLNGGLLLGSTFGGRIGISITDKATFFAVTVQAIQTDPF